MNEQIIHNLVSFLLDHTGSIFGTWQGRLTAQEQKALFGKALCGKRLITICGADETVSASKKVCFGADFETETFSWTAL